MDMKTKDKVLDRNQKMVDMVIERVKRDFYDDISIIGLTGSFRGNHFYDKSDLDLILVNDTDRGWAISTCFIMDEVGYDIYCTPWAHRLEDQANLESYAVGSLVDLEILYTRDAKSLERFKALQQRAKDKLSLKMGEDNLSRADKTFLKAKAYYGDIAMGASLHEASYGRANLLFEAINTLVHLNNTYIKGGVINYMEELDTYNHLPDKFKDRYFGLIQAKTQDEMKEKALDLLVSLRSLISKMKVTYFEKKTPTYDNLKGVYEELWCNCRNKLLRALNLGDMSYAIHVVRGTQDFLDDLHQDIGTPKYELMAMFDPKDMAPCYHRFMEIMDEFKELYEGVGRQILIYDSFDALYKDFMKPMEA